MEPTEETAHCSRIWCNRLVRRNAIQEPSSPDVRARRPHRQEFNAVIRRSDVHRANSFYTGLRWRPRCRRLRKGRLRRLRRPAPQAPSPPVRRVKAPTRSDRRVPRWLPATALVSAIHVRRKADNKLAMLVRELDASAGLGIATCQKTPADNSANHPRPPDSAVMRTFSDRRRGTAKSMNLRTFGTAERP